MLSSRAASPIAPWWRAPIGNGRGLPGHPSPYWRRRRADPMTRRRIISSRMAPGSQPGRSTAAFTR
jgi:hypothetical protein